MATKAAELTNPASCLSKALDDEPIFVLRAQDRFASHLVRAWAGLFKEFSGDQAKYSEALALADEMAQWPARRLPD